ncbi:MAG: dihydrodipicolinate synthase family protein [Terriglobales bacterium]
MRLSGVIAALTTPFDDAGELRLERLGANIEVYNGTPLAGYLVLGSSGEAIGLDAEEKAAVLARAAASAAPGKLLLAGTGEESLRGTLAMTARAAALGYHAAVVRTPHYYKKNMTQPVLAAFYRELADAAALPVVLYNIPPLTGVDLALDTVLELAEHPRIIGLKESSGNMDKLMRIAAARPGFPVLVGGASTIYPSLCAGAAGVILALAAAAPSACCQVARAFASGDHALALAAQRALLAACAAFEPFGIAGLKAAVDAAGLYGGPPRRPLRALEGAPRAAIATAITALDAGREPAAVAR